VLLDARLGKQQPGQGDPEDKTAADAAPPEGSHVAPRRDPGIGLQEEPLPPYTVELVRGVDANSEEIGEWIDTYALGWSRERMPAVDRVILTLGAYEIVLEEDVPDEVILEAMADLAGKLSTDRSPGFISGVLGRISSLKQTLR
jgi:N utilization substance protein B